MRRDATTRHPALLPALLISMCALAAPGCQPGTELSNTPPVSGGSAGDTSGPRIIPARAEAILADVRATPTRATLINVWATWCAPCREEFPDLVRLYRTYEDRGLRLVLVSADFDDQLEEARAFLERHGVDFDTYLKTGDDMEFIDSLNPRWTGALPATFVYDAGGHLSDFWEGMATYEELERRVLPLLDSTSTQ